MTPILTTKLHIPQPRRHAVSRPRLFERLNSGLNGHLTLLSAPAGFGKTTLVSEWLAAQPRSAVWLSLDEKENDLTRFLTYLVAALQPVVAASGNDLSQLLSSSPPPSSEAVLTTLINATATLPDPFVLVLDDYHVIDAELVHQALAYFVEHLPSQLRLVMLTREDPPLPLARLRAWGQLTELRAADLRFTAAEAAAFLNQTMHLALAAPDADQLADRTEGWIVGLQLAALSLQGRHDISDFIQTFAGNHRHVMDYLVAEVLQRQPESVRSFLLRTAILDRLYGSLCDAVTGQLTGTKRLEALERGNFFVVPLDDQRHWYRYHHLFAEALAAHLRAEQPEQIALLHRRASAWFEQHGMVADAIRHALTGEDFERAARMIELALPDMRRERQDALLLGWLKALPDELLHFRPVLSVGYAYALLSSGELEAAHTWLRDAERWLAMTADTNVSPSQMIVVDAEEFRRLPASIAVYRAALAQAVGAGGDTVKYARQVLDLLPEEDHLGRGAAAALLGLASWASGDLEVAHRAFAEGIANVQKAGNISDAISGATALADIRIAQGRLREAMRAYERGLQLASEQSNPILQGMADVYVGLSEISREHNDLLAARQHLLKSQELAGQTGSPHNRSRWHIAMARLKEGQGDRDGALDDLREAERVYASDLFPNVRPVAAVKARLWIALGRLGDAHGWAREQGLSAADDLSYVREFEHITLARTLLARYKSDCSDNCMREAMMLLDRLWRAAEDGERMGSVIEIRVLQALAHQARGDSPAALAALRHALTLAEPEGYIRIFADEGLPMTVLLQEAAKRRISLSYVRQLLAATRAAEEGKPGEQVLLEPLSARERDVLRLLRTDLTGPQIARELVVSLDTFNTHTKHIYRKLQVNNRRAAVRQAEALDLL